MGADVIVVSGAASGIGRAICELAADRGMTVGLLDADADRVEDLATHLRASGARATEQAGRRLLSALAGAVGPHLVDEAPRGDRDQPAEWFFWDPGPGPRGDSLDQRFLNRILTPREVAVAPNHGR